MKNFRELGRRLGLTVVAAGIAFSGVFGPERAIAQGSGDDEHSDIPLGQVVPEGSLGIPDLPLEVALPEAAEDWLYAENFADVQLAQPLLDVLSARDGAAKKRPLTEYDFNAVQLGELPIVIDWGLYGEGMKRKERMLNSQYGVVDEFIVVPHRLVDEFLSTRLPELIQAVPRKTILVITTDGETKALDTSILPTTPQIIIVYCDLSDIDNVPGLSSRALLLESRQYKLRVYDEEHNVMKVMVAQAYKNEIEDFFSIGVSISTLQAIISAFNNMPYDVYHETLKEQTANLYPIVPMVNYPDVGFSFLAPRLEWDWVSLPQYKEYALVD